MQESQQLPRRIVQAEEIARYEECPLAWWYDRKHHFGAAAPEEIQRYMDIYQLVHGAGIKELPAYHVMEKFLQSKGGDAAPVKPVPVKPSGPPGALAGCIGLVAIGIIGLVILGIIMMVARP